MRNFMLIIAGIFLCVAFSWTALVLKNHKYIGQLSPVTEDGTAAVSETLYPLKPSGLAQQGKKVYISMGCASCHTQQVSRKGFGGDFLRGWGDRGSVPRDYVRQKRVLLGNMRIGSDLSNTGTKEHDTAWHLIHLYDPRVKISNSNMPRYKFLFTKQKIDERHGPSPDALELSGSCAPPEGYEVVPTNRANALVAYLLSLKQNYDFPETLVGGAKEAKVLTGKEIYALRCVMCHQANGNGLPGTFPALAGSKWVIGSKERTINVVLSGIGGPITVKGEAFNSAMPAWGPTMSNKEIADVLTHIRSEWGNEADAVTEEDVAKERDDKGVKATTWTAAELLELYPMK